MKILHQSMRYLKPFLFLIIVSLIVSSCGKYQKVLKSEDYDYKYKMANEYYENQDYARALTLYEELASIFKGSVRAEEVFFKYAYCNYYRKDYILAEYYFDNFTKTYPASEYAEEAQYMQAFCLYKMAPKPRLDQSNTVKAIEAFQLFINLYPQSEKAQKATVYIEELRERLVYKSYLSARLYFDLGDYNAAIIALRNSLKDYPETEYKEEISYLILESSFLLALNSIESKKQDRLRNAVDEYYAFRNDFPDSEYMRDANRYFEQANKLIN